MDLAYTHVLDPRHVPDDHDVRKALGHVIERVALVDNQLLIKVSAGTLTISDAGQSCCEHRYISCDDDLESQTGARLLGIERGTGPEFSAESGDVHDAVFIKVSTSVGGFTICTHNVHNGYYGGFDLQTSWSDAC